MELPRIIRFSESMLDPRQRNMQDNNDHVENGCTLRKYFYDIFVVDSIHVEQEKIICTHWITLVSHFETALL